MILDSTFLIDVLRGDDTVTGLLKELDATGTPLVSSITVMELTERIHLGTASERERTAVEESLSDIHVFPFDRDCATSAGRINAELVAAGEPIDETDVMIAATALVHEKPVVTDNVEHFSRIQDLPVIEY